MRKINVPIDNGIDISSNSPVLDVKYDKNRERIIFDINQQEISHKHLKETGGDPHPQYLDMIRHRAMDHQFILDESDKRYLPSMRNHIKYFFERYEVDIEPGCMGYTVIPCGEYDIANILVATRKNPKKLKFDVLYEGKTIFKEPLDDVQFYQSSHGKSVILVAGMPYNGYKKVVGSGLLEIMIKEAEDVSDLLIRIEFV